MHHTKTKADIGLTKVIADLTLKGYTPCIPLSEHQPYDLVAIGTDGKVIKVQVKYSTLKNGVIEVRFRSSWADRNGTHIRPYKIHEFDYYAIYCPERDLVLYVPNGRKQPKVLRFTKSANGQMQGVHWFEDYLILQREPSETTRDTPERVKT